MQVFARIAADEACSNSWPAMRTVQDVELCIDVKQLEGAACAPALLLGFPVVYVAAVLTGLAHVAVASGLQGCAQSQHVLEGPEQLLRGQ